MRRTKDPSTTSSHKAGMLAALGTGLAGALLLGACGGTSLPASHQASHTAGATSCHSFVSCLTKKASKVRPTASVPTQSQNPKLTPSALGPLAGDLSQADQQIMLSAMDSLPASAIRAVTSRLDSLSASDATRLGADLSQVIGADQADAQAYADALVGTGPPQTASGAAQAEMQAFASALGQLPGALAQGNDQIASFVSQILSTTLPHIEQMMEAALSQVPAEVVPLALADVNAGLAKASATEVQGLSAEMEANSYVATERWMEAFS